MKFPNDAGAGALLGVAVGALDGSGSGNRTGLRNVPFTSCPANVTWATLFALAWARKSEYGTATDGTDVGARTW